MCRNISTFELNMLDYSSYECKLDAKGRVALPSAFKKQLANATDDQFIIKRSIFQECLEIHSKEQWNEISGKLNKLNRFVKKNNDFIRMFIAGMKIVELDGSGRLQLSKDQIQFAQLDKDIVLVATGKLIEVWDKIKYEQVANPSYNDLASLAEEVMGNNDDN